MAQYGGDQQYGQQTRHTDAHGNPIQQTDEYGTTGHTTGGSGTGLSYGQIEHQEAGHGSVGDKFDVGGGFQNQPSATPIGGAGNGTGSWISTAGAETGTGGGVLHRLGSSSSSSSEDDGMGGRRKKKGVMQKIKEKLPGSHGDQQQTTHTTTTTTTGAGVGGTGYGETRERNEVMEKIKEKLPGHH